MQKTKAELPALIIVAAVIGACFLRFFQLLRLSDVNADTINKYSTISAFIYGVLAIAFVLGIIRASKVPAECNVGARSRSIAVCSVLAAVGMFTDFVNRSYRCFDYMLNTRYVDYMHIVPLAVSGILAIFSSFYLICISLKARGRNLDFRNFRLLHFSVIAYGMVRLVSITTSIIDVRLDVGMIFEFLFLVFTVLVWFCYVASIDSSGRLKSVAFTVSSIMSLSVAVIYFVPNLLCAIAGKESILSETMITSFVYITVGICDYAILFGSTSAKE